jgi:hypothetical protein
MTKTIYEDFAVSQVTVGTTATKIVSGIPGTDEVTIENLGTTDVYIGKSTVTTANGFLLPGTKGASITLGATQDIYGIVGAGTQAVSILVTF